MTRNRLSRMDRGWLWWHNRRHGHTVRVRTGLTVAMGDASRGNLLTCVCGKERAS